MVLRAGRLTRPRLAVLAALALAGCGGPPAASESTPAAQERFIPATQRAGRHLVMPVAFTDGTRVQLRYRATLRLAELGVEPYGSATLHGDSPSPGRSDFVARDFVIRYGDAEDWLSARPGATLIARYLGAGGQSVGFWSGGTGESWPNYLAFQFGRWAVLVYDFTEEFDGGAAAMTDAERASWSRSFSGRETGDGFLRLDDSGPLRLARAREHAGPTLAFGSVGPSFELEPARCRPHRGFNRRIAGKRVSWQSGRYANWCLSDSIRIAAHGNRRFIGRLIRGLELVTER